MKALRVGIIILISFLTLGCCADCQYLVVPRPLTEGYTVLTPPRSGLIVGAQWNSIVGIASEGLSEDKLDIQESVQAYNVTNTVEAKTTLAAQIANLFQGRIQSDIVDSSTLRITKAEIVRVKNYDALEDLVSEYYIWEGIRVKDFSFESKSGYNINADLEAKWRDAVVTATGGRGSSQIIDVKGANIYVAYKLVGFDPAGKRDIHNISIPQSHLVGATLIGDKYKLVLETMNANETSVFQSPKKNGMNCAYIMKIMSMAGMRPKTYYWKMNCDGRSDNDIYFLDRTFRDGEVVTDTLILNKIHLSKDTYGNVTCDSGDFTLQEWRLRVKQHQ